jgi:arylsulfatase A-like enzyme
MLTPLGYHSAIVGKWHLGLSSPNTPNERGFDLFRGYLGDMMDDYYNHRRHDINYMRFNEDEVDPVGHATDLFTDWACEYVRERKASQQPFFLYLAYNAPHTPIQPPDDWLAKVKKREPGITDKRAKLVALIEHLDAGIGKFVDMLKETGQEKKTLVFFTSDNGGQLDVGANNGATRDGKQSMYEGGLRVPACAVWPGTIPVQSRTETIAMSIDLLPTICEAVGVKLEHGVDGVSLWPTLLGEQQQLHRDHFFHRREGGNQYQGLTINAVRRGDWKLLQNSPFSPLELYNLASDPLESTSLASNNRAKFDELSKALRVQVQRGGSVPWQAPTPDYRGTETLAR